MKPFCNPIIKDIIEAQWFTTSKTKVDAHTTMRMLSEKEVPALAVLLVVAAVSVVQLSGPCSCLIGHTSLD